jgi:fluoride ion exporter CrcB/FEX
MVAASGPAGIPSWARMAVAPLPSPVAVVLGVLVPGAVAASSALRTDRTRAALRGPCGAPRRATGLLGASSTSPTYALGRVNDAREGGLWSLVANAPANSLVGTAPRPSGM